MNMTQPENKTGSWPKCSFFAVYDGHGGQECADFLKEKLHKIIINQDSFPSNPVQALTTGCM
jgi:protein phosphatase 2C family protein 2/3